VAALRRVSRHPVVYAELPGAQHAFDVFHSTRSAYAVEAVTRFVESVYAAHVTRRGKPAGRQAALATLTRGTSAAGRDPTFTAFLMDTAPRCLRFSHLCVCADHARQRMTLVM